MKQPPSVTNQDSSSCNPATQHCSACMYSARLLALAATACTYNTYMANKTISIPDDVVPVIETLGMPFSTWVTEQLRRHEAATAMPFSEQLLADAELAKQPRPTAKESAATGKRMGQTAPW